MKFFRPLSDPLPDEFNQSGRLALEALRRLNAYDQLELACRNLLGVLIAACPRSEGTKDNLRACDTLCDAVGGRVCAEISRLRFNIPQ